MFQKPLKKEEQTRTGAVREEKEQSWCCKLKIFFLQSAAQRAQHPLPDNPQPIPEGLVDMKKHLHNLFCKILDSMKKNLHSEPQKCRTYSRLSEGESIRAVS